MNNVSIFTFRKMPVRAVERNGENFFVIRDICNILGWREAACRKLGTQGSASGTLPEKRSISQAGRGGEGSGAG